MHRCAGALYKLDIPTDMPVSQFWSVTVYDRATLSTYDHDTMIKNPDGSLTIYIGPDAPAGLEANWIPTAGKRPLPTIRFYGGTTALFDRTFKQADPELIN